MLWVFNFHEDQNFVDFVGFLSMIIYVVLYTQCLRYNYCSAWFLDIRISMLLIPKSASFLLIVTAPIVTYKTDYICV